MSKPTINAETANHVLWHFGRGGYRPGDFTVNLMHAWNTADPANAAKLATAFPELCAALTLANYTEDGVMELRRIAEGEVQR
jgi:hypothetical protein